MRVGCEFEALLGYISETLSQKTRTKNTPKTKPLSTQLCYKRSHPMATLPVGALRGTFCF